MLRQGLTPMLAVQASSKPQPYLHHASSFTINGKINRYITSHSSRRPIFSCMVDVGLSPSFHLVKLFLHRNRNWRGLLLCTEKCRGINSPHSCPSPLTPMLAVQASSKPQPYLHHASSFTINRKINKYIISFILPFVVLCFFGWSVP